MNELAGLRFREEKGRESRILGFVVKSRDPIYNIWSQRDMQTDGERAWKIGLRSRCDNIILPP